MVRFGDGTNGVTVLASCPADSPAAQTFAESGAKPFEYEPDIAGLRKFPDREVGRDVTVNFEIVDFGNQPLLSGENDAAFFSIWYLPEEGRARACSHKTNDG